MHSPEKELIQDTDSESPEDFATKNYYERLGVPPWAPPDRISHAFRDLSKKYHPDHGGDARVFKYLSEAYSTLKDENERWQYDHYTLGTKRQSETTTPKKPEEAKDNEHHEEAPAETTSSEEDTTEKWEETDEAETLEEESNIQQETAEGERRAQEETTEEDTETAPEEDSESKRAENQQLTEAKEKERLDELYRDLETQKNNQEKVPAGERADASLEKTPRVRTFEGHAYPLHPEVVEAMRSALTDVYDGLPHRGSISTLEVMKLMRQTEIGNIEEQEGKYAKKAMKKFARRVAWLYWHTLSRSDFVAKGMEVLEPLMAGTTLKKTFKESVRKNAENEEQERAVMYEYERQSRERAGTVYEVRPKSTPKPQGNKEGGEGFKKAA